MIDITVDCDICGKSINNRGGETICKSCYGELKETVSDLEERISKLENDINDLQNQVDDQGD
jgi:peptidoglycan hydrolase CwlO-like protein